MFLKQELHLLEYNRRTLDYLKALEAQRSKQKGATFFSAPLRPFSLPSDIQGYADKPISHEMITEAYLDFVTQARQVESESYLRTLPSTSSELPHPQATNAYKNWNSNMRLNGQHVQSIREGVAD